MKRLILLIALIGISSCSTLSPASLPFPKKPFVTFFQKEESYCLNGPDAFVLHKYLNKLDEYKKSLKRLEDAS